MHKLFLTTLLLWILFNSIFAQEYSTRLYTTENGLVQSQVMCLFQDRRGYLWVGTKGGLSRFDGVNFRNYTEKEGLLHNFVGAIAEDSCNNIWVLTQKGLCQLIIPHNSFINERIVKYPIENLTSWNGDLVIIPDDKGNSTIWFNNLGRLRYFKHGSYHYASNEYEGIDTLTIRALAYEKKTLWIGADKGLFFIQNSKLKQGKWNKPVNELIRNSKEQLFGVSGNSIFSVLEAKTLVTLDKFVQRVLFNPFSENKIWFSLENDYFEQDLKTQKVNKLTYGTVCSDVIFDNEYNLWIGSEQGLVYLPTTAFLNFTTENSGIYSDTWTVNEDKNGNFWFASYFHTDLKCYDGKSVKSDQSFLTFTKGATFVPGSLTSGNGNVLFANNSGVLEFDGTHFERKTPYNDANHDYSAMYLYEDVENNQLLMGLRKCFGILHKSGKYTQYNRITGFNNLNNIIAIEKDKQNRYWLCHHTEIILFDGKNIVKLDSIHLNGCTGAYSIYKDYKGNLWLGGTNGLWFYDYKNCFNLTNPFISNIFTFVKGIDSTYIIAGSISNLILLDLKKFYKKNMQPLKNKPVAEYRIFDKQNGFLGKDCQQNGTCVDSKGSVWIPAGDRVVRFDPKDVKSIIINPQIQITAKILNKQMEWQGMKSTVLKDSVIQMQYNQNHIRFDFINVSFAEKNRISYAFRLQGVDNDWRRTTEDRYAIYTNLYPGNYVFEVMTYYMGKETGSKALVDFRIVPAYWQTWWFKFLIVIISVFLIIILLRYVQRRREQKLRIQNLIERQQHELELVKSKIEGQEEQRQHTAKELHDGVGGDLVVLKAKLRNINDELLHPDIKEEIVESVNNIHQNVRNLSYDLSAPVFSIVNFEEAVRDRLIKITQVFKTQNKALATIEFQFHSDPSIDWNEVSSKIQHELYRIVQEALSNILKYAEATEVVIQIMQHDHTLNLMIEDNGKGFDTNKHTTGLGLKNIAHRILSLQGTLDIDSRLGRGTTLNVEIPFFYVNNDE